MEKEIMKKILEKIKEYKRILLFRHFRPDGDAIGSTKGLQEILRQSFPEKEIYLVNEDYADYLAFLGPEDGEIPDELFADALGIVLDTGRPDRISSKRSHLCKELIKIDHHINHDPYGDLVWVEEELSSTCELVVKFYETFRDELVLNLDAATYLYTGMVTDSGRFRFRGVNGDTLRRAGLLLDQGVDTEKLYANLYLEEFDQLKFKAYVYENMQITDNGVAFLFVDKSMQERFNLTLEHASSSVTYLEGIKDCLCWIAFIETNDAEQSIRARIRSRFVHINELAEKYRGGGHACASGATLYNMDELRALVNDADALIKEYKETHEGWL